MIVYGVRWEHGDIDVVYPMPNKLGAEHAIEYSNRIIDAWLDAGKIASREEGIEIMGKFSIVQSGEEGEDD